MDTPAPTPPAPPRPPVFCSAQIRVRSLPIVGGGAVAEISVCGVVVTLDENEARALCTALRDALDLTPALRGAPR